jgi:hypothetical protein
MKSFVYSMPLFFRRVDNTYETRKRAKETGGEWKKELRRWCVKTEDCAEEWP